MKHHTIRVALAIAPFLLAVPACKEKSTTPAPAKTAEPVQKTAEAAAEKAADKATEAMSKQP
ncbi:MAG: hypothetical protein RLZZ558_718 [Planctomycetota bacterium]|jgi:hypothetical protein